MPQRFVQWPVPKLVPCAIEREREGEREREREREGESLCTLL